MFERLTFFHLALKLSLWMTSVQFTWIRNVNGPIILSQLRSRVSSLTISQDKTVTCLLLRHCSSTPANIFRGVRCWKWSVVSLWLWWGGRCGISMTVVRWEVWYLYDCGPHCWYLPAWLRMLTALGSGLSCGRPGPVRVSRDIHVTLLGWQLTTQISSN